MNQPILKNAEFAFIGFEGSHKMRQHTGTCNNLSAGASVKSPQRLILPLLPKTPFTSRGACMIHLAGWEVSKAQPAMKCTPSNINHGSSVQGLEELEACIS